MNIAAHHFVRELPPLDAAAFCPQCREPWEHCECEPDPLPAYRGAFDTEGRH